MSVNAMRKKKPQIHSAMTLRIGVDRCVYFCDAYTSPFRHFMFLLTDESARAPRGGDGGATTVEQKESHVKCQNMKETRKKCLVLVAKPPHTLFRCDKHRHRDVYDCSAWRLDEKCQRHDGIIFFDDSKMTLSFSVQFFGVSFRTISFRLRCHGHGDSVAISVATVAAAAKTESHSNMHCTDWAIHSNHCLRRVIGSYRSAANE